MPRDNLPQRETWGRHVQEGSLWTRILRLLLRSSLPSPLRGTPGLRRREPNLQLVLQHVRRLQGNLWWRVWRLIRITAWTVQTSYKLTTKHWQFYFAQVFKLETLTFQILATDQTFDSSLLRNSFEEFSPCTRSRSNNNRMRQLWKSWRK